MASSPGGYDGGAAAAARRRRGRRGAARADPRDRHQGARAAGARRPRSAAEFPEAAYRLLGQVRPAEPAVPRGVRRRRASRTRPTCRWSRRSRPPGRASASASACTRLTGQRRRRPTAATTCAPSGCRGCSSGDWLGAYCLSEPQAGSDVSGIRTRAVRDGDEYVVNGTKQWISNGSCADYYILFARTSDDPKRGLSAFVVPAGTAGHELRRPREEDGPGLRRHHAR